MALINHTPTDNRAQLYGRPCQDKTYDPRRNLTSRSEWFGYDDSCLKSKFTPKIQAMNVDRAYHVKKVVEIETGRVFESISDVAVYLGITQSAVSHRIKKCLGYRLLDDNASFHKQVRHIETGKVYNNVYACMDGSGYSLTTIRRHCQGRANKQLFEYVEGTEYKVATKKVLNVETGEIYQSVKDASEKTGLSFHTVRDHCQCKGKANPRFKYVD